MEEKNIEKSRADTPDEIMQEITTVLHGLGVPAHLKGYYYLRQAIYMCIKDPDLLEGITKCLYPDVAKKNKTTSSRVERAMRHAITVAWERGDMTMIDQWFGYTISNRRGRPTNGEFIAMVTDRMNIWKLAG